VVGEKLVRLVSLLRLLRVAPLVVQETDAAGPSDPDPNDLDLSDPDRLSVWVRLDAWLCHLRYCAVHTAVLQQGVIPVADLPYPPKRDSVAAGEHAAYTVVHSRQDAVVRDALVQPVLRLPDSWVGAVGLAPVRCCLYMVAGWDMDY